MNKTLPLACAALLACAGALAQTPGSSTTAAGASTSTASTGAHARSALSHGDAKLIRELAESNAGEIATGKIALEKSQNAQVKAFAQRMVDDHTKAQAELRTLASAKGAELPADAELLRKAEDHGLSRKSGSGFDEEYAERVGAKDHGHTLKLLEKAERDSRDPDIKALAAKMIPTVEEHLKMAGSLPGAEKDVAKAMKTHERDAAKTAKSAGRDAATVR